MKVLDVVVEWSGVEWSEEGVCGVKRECVA